ncbi:MAG: hypothetical protein R3335_13245 [Anaerolineales bacterium]|nr:hypothetical protein [Anaerolineales bacterium]
MKKIIVILMFLPLTLLAACGEAETPPPAPTPGGPSGEILFEDDFLDPQSGWDRASNESGSTDYFEGGYLITVDQPNTDVFANPGQNFLDTTIEVKAQMVAGSNVNSYGLICRYQDPGNFYFFIIGSDREWGIGAVIDGGPPQLIGESVMQFSRRINPGTEPNLIRADCSGNTLRLYVNGRILDAVTDNRLVSGDIGLIAGTFDTPGTQILFDDLVVRNP